MTTSAHYLLKFAAAALLCSLHFTARVVRGESACETEYLYTQQPPANIACNPYVNGTLKLHCAVIGEEDLEIRWYFSQNDNESLRDVHSADTKQLTESSKYSFTPLHVEDGVAEGLIVQNLTSNEDHGWYWCQAFFSDGSYYLSAAMAFRLFKKDFLQFITNSCPETFLMDSNIRCADLIKIPPATTNLPMVTSTMSSLQSSSPAQIQVTSTLLMVQTLSVQPFKSTSAVSTSPTPTPLTPIMVVTPQTTNSNSVPTESSTGPSTDNRLTDPPTNPPTSNPMDTITFYAAMGTAGFLVLVVVALIAVILFLCRKRCHRIGLAGSEKNRETGFEQLSVHDLSGEFKRRITYHHDISMQIPGTTRSTHSSGDYAEIGPALVTLRSQGHDYSEIPEFRPTPPPVPQSAIPSSNRYSSHEPEPDAYLTPSDRENPYDLPIPPSEENPKQSQGGLQQQERVPAPTTPPPPPPSNYQIFEKVPKPDNTTAAVISSEDVHSSPPLSPNNYHTLEKPMESEFQDSSISQLETIPEHPYHILEEQMRANSLESTPVPSLLEVGSNSDIKEATPGFTDPEVEEEASESHNQSSTSAADGDYDRLVDPPQLYRLLEHSPSLIQPRIREFPVGGSSYNHLSGFCENSGGLCYLSPQTEETTLSSKSGTTSDSSSEVVFDDPQYTVSPRRNLPATKKSKIESRSHSRSKPYKHIQESIRDAEEMDLSKYLGDYERDPSYMELLQQRSSENSARGSTDSDDYPDSTYSPLTSDTFLLPKGTSSEVPHVYQSLETQSMDPRQQYEKLRKQDAVAKETVI